MYSFRAGGCAVALVIVMAACGPKAPQTYRLVPKALVPPGVASPAIEKRTVTADVAPGHGRCTPGPIDIKQHGKSLRVTLSSADLDGKPAGWLRAWATDREAEGCIAEGESLKLAQRIVESVPLDSGFAYRLMHAPFNAREASFVDIGPENRLQVDSPILREGAPSDAPIIEGMKASPGTSPGSISVEGKLSSNVVGYETAWYGLRRKAKGEGFDFVAVYAESHIQGVVNRQPQPRLNPFQFRPEAAFYRMYYRGDQTIIVVSAPTPAELERETKALRADPGACGTFPKGSCVAMPRTMGANAHILVLVNGNEVALPVGSNLRRAIVAGGEKSPDGLVGRLTIRKLHGGTLATVEFDAARTDILNLTLVGGEEISWK